MSSSSRRRLRGWLGDRRGQSEPIAALVAVLAIGVGLALYAGVAAEQQPESEPTDAAATLQRIDAAILDDGVYHDETFVGEDRFARAGETIRIRVNWSSGGATLYGPEPPADADVARRPITYSANPGERSPAVLTVWVWES